MKPKFIHLHLHTEYSLSDGLLTIPSMMEKLANSTMPAVAITDLSNLYATVKFYQAAIKAGIKPIIGAEFRIANEKPSFEDASSLILLCQSQEGYKNLLKIVSLSYLKGQKSGKPLVQKTWLSSLAEGLIAISCAEEGDIGQALLAQDMNMATHHLKRWRSLFPNRFYIEVSRVGKTHEALYIPAAIKLAAAHAIPIVATNNVRFLSREDFEAHEARVCIQEGVTLNDPHRLRRYTDQQYLRSAEEMQDLFADLPEALENTVEIAKRCNISFSLDKNLLPRFPVPSHYTTEQYLSEVARVGLDQRLQNLLDHNDHEKFTQESRPYRQRLEQELEVINKMGFAGYFLIVFDFTKWAKENGIPVGPGRGSGPGSLVAYALKITDLDPIALDLLFERFLNPDRVSMPDFDIDFCIEGRDRVIEYVMEKHGHDNVSQIITYGTMAARAVVRDVGRVLGFPYGFVDKIAKLIPFELGITLAKAREQEALLSERYDQEEDVRTLMDLAHKLEGLVRNVGKHAGGLVIAPGKLTDFVPLYCEPNEEKHPVTQFDKDDVEAVGLVKFDFLGLKTLTIINRALQVINKNRHLQNEPPIDISHIPLNDKKTFELLKACKSTAVFQLESYGMRDLTKRLQPDCFEDLIALVALYRPGPLQSGMVEDFINRKGGRSRVFYPHPSLEPILRPTYGVILYQEQVMQIARVLAGYTLGSADVLRHAMGKKKTDEMAKQRVIFCRGAVERGVNAEIATHIYDLMEKFASYAFNKPHSASYALIAYQTAWLKTHYPAAFMAAVLSSEMDRTEKIMILLEECSALQLTVIPPDINKSDYYFNAIDETHIMYGLGAIKGIGVAAIENIVTTRQQNGLFKDLFDFCQRIDLRKVNRRVLEALIKSGGFDSLGRHRASLFASLHLALQHAEQILYNQTYGQHDLLAVHIEELDASSQYVDTQPWSKEVLLPGEKETLGFYLSGHPLDSLRKELAQFASPIAKLSSTQGQKTRIAGLISNIRIRQTKRGDRIGIFTLDDSTKQIEVVCFNEAFTKHRSLITEDQLVVVEGELSLDDFTSNIRMASRELYTLEQMREKYAKYIRIHLLDAQSFDIEHLKQIIEKYLGGRCSIILRFLKNNVQAEMKLGENWCITPTDDALKMLKEQLPTQDVELVYS